MAKGATEAARWLSVPIGLVFWATVFWLGGRWVDDRWSTEPWGQVIGAVIGWTLGFVYVFWAVKIAMRASNQSDRVGGDQR